MIYSLPVSIITIPELLWLTSVHLKFMYINSVASYKALQGLNITTYIPAWDT